MKQVNMHEAKTHLSRLVDEAAAGEEVVIAKAGRPLVKLVPYVAERTPRRPGGWEGQVWISPDFDDPLSEFEDAFYNGPIFPEEDE
jgi:prevent-host-death family protein